mgnify:FL=1
MAEFMKGIGKMTKEMERDTKSTQMETFIPALFDKGKLMARASIPGNQEKSMMESGLRDSKKGTGCGKD